MTEKMTGIDEIVARHMAVVRVMPPFDRLPAQCARAACLEVAADCLATAEQNRAELAGLRLKLAHAEELAESRAYELAEFKRTFDVPLTDPETRIMRKDQDSNSNENCSRARRFCYEAGPACNVPGPKAVMDNGSVINTVCTRKQGHEGDHVACSHVMYSRSQHNIARWRNSGERDPEISNSKLQNSGEELPRKDAEDAKEPAECSHKHRLCSYSDGPLCCVSGRDSTGQKKFCTRKKGHEGDHVACASAQHNIARWRNSGEQAICDREGQPPVIAQTWQPMETAPRDGTRISVRLVRGQYIGNSLLRKDVVIEALYWAAGNFHTWCAILPEEMNVKCERFLPINEPSGWMPLQKELPAGTNEKTEVGDRRSEVCPLTSAL